MTKVDRSPEKDGEYDVRKHGDTPNTTTYGPHSGTTTYGPHSGPTTYGPDSPVIVSPGVYDGEPINTILDDTLAPIIIRNFGIIKSIIASVIFMLAGIISIFSSLNSFTNEKYFDFLPSFPPNSIYLIIIISIFFFLIGYLFISSLYYYYRTKCKKCGEDFALKEYKDPLVHETTIRDGLRKTTWRYYKCKFCGDETTKKSKITIKDNM